MSVDDLKPTRRLYIVYMYWDVGLFEVMWSDWGMAVVVVVVVLVGRL